MSSIATIIMDDTNALTAADWDYDPSTGTGSAMVDEMTAPEDFDSATVLFDPYV